MNSAKLFDMKKTDNYRLTFFDNLSDIYYDDDTMDIAMEIASDIIHRNGLIVHGVKINHNKLYDEDMHYLQTIYNDVCKGAKKDGFDLKSYVSKEQKKGMVIKTINRNETMHYPDAMPIFHEYIVDKHREIRQELGIKIQVVLNLARLIIKTDKNVSAKDFATAFLTMEKYQEFVDGIS